MVSVIFYGLHDLARSDQVIKCTLLSGEQCVDAALSGTDFLVELDHGFKKNRLYFEVKYNTFYTLLKRKYEVQDISLEKSDKPLFIMK